MSEGWESEESDSEVPESEESEFSSEESDSDVSEGWESEDSDSGVSEGWESEDSSEDSESDVWETESAPSGYKHHPDECFPSPKDAFNAYVKKAAFERSLSPEGRHESPQQHYERSVPAEEGSLIIEAGPSRESFDSMVLLGAYALWEREKAAGRSEESSEHYYYAALVTVYFDNLKKLEDQEQPPGTPRIPPQVPDVSVGGRGGWARRPVDGRCTAVRPLGEQMAAEIDKSQPVEWVWWWAAVDRS
ncbi:unnamed protein product [Vitrella brassicaformis CCMP3155]|uniref:Uncharacterized protein n=1 Tax=Vitrella brassicaformis (strain CCMP3155) TaxID=1169540 RepID=A0A0G4FQE7_VITBC|nr:unnamed protein product [Vitrella brassicaformis CCMP3155]|eukprot:CEM16659.1 unnamed protein product [Vitrella brassicaformis CCMP3155]